MNISIPDELRERMRPLDTDTNWSDLAAEAFKKKVEAAEYIAQGKSAMIQRLRATEIEDIGGIEEFAHRAGADWAANHARMAELRRLQSHAERNDGLDFARWEHLVKVILGDGFFENRSDWIGKFRTYGKDMPDEYEEQYTKAFAEGALEAFEAAQDDE